MMLTLTRIIRWGRRPQSSLTAGWVLYALIGGLLATLVSPTTLRAQTPAGTPITSITVLTFVGQNGLTYTAADTLTLLVGQAGGADVIPPRSVVTDPSTTVTFAHTITNIGNTTDGLTVSATSRAGWVTRVYRDADNSGTLTAGDQLLSSPITLAMGATAPILVQEDVPAAALRGSTDSVDVRVASTFDPTATDLVVDATAIRAAGIRVDLGKSVNQATTTVGDVVTYTVTYSAVGAGTATSLVITDVIPAGTTYVPGTMRVKGTSVTDALDVDAGTFDGPNNNVVFRLGDVPASTTCRRNTSSPTSQRRRTARRSAPTVVPRHRCKRHRSCLRSHSRNNSSGRRPRISANSCSIAFVTRTPRLTSRRGRWLLSIRSAPDWPLSHRCRRRR